MMLRNEAGDLVGCRECKWHYQIDKLYPGRRLGCRHPRAVEIHPGGLPIFQARGNPSPKAFCGEGGRFFEDIRK